jgi:hypothetical protein
MPEMNGEQSGGATVNLKKAVHKSGQAAAKPTKWAHFASMGFTDGSDNAIASLNTIDVSDYKKYISIALIC